MPALVKSFSTSTLPPRVFLSSSRLFTLCLFLVFRTMIGALFFYRVLVMPSSFLFYIAFFKEPKIFTHILSFCVVVFRPTSGINVYHIFTAPI